MIHFSLHYYDRAGRLVRTVPPGGVDVLSDGADRSQTPAHTQITEYDYNSLGQLVRTESPDGGEAEFFYDRYGRLRFSRDARQAANGEYSYTKFDDLGRVIEAGISDEDVAFDLFSKDININVPDYPSTGSERTHDDDVGDWLQTEDIHDEMNRSRADAECCHRAADAAVRWLGDFS